MSQFFFSLPALHCWIGIHNVGIHNVHMTLHDMSKLSQAFESTQIHTGKNLVQKKLFLWHDGIMQMLSRPKLQSFLRKHFQKPMPSSWEHLQKPWLKQLAQSLDTMQPVSVCHGSSLSRFDKILWTAQAVRMGFQEKEPWTACWMCWTLVGLWISMDAMANWYGGNSQLIARLFHVSCWKTTMVLDSTEKLPSWARYAYRTWTVLLIFPAESWSSPGFFLAIKALKVSNETAMIQQSKRQLASSCWNSCHLMSQSVADVHDKHETVGTVGTARLTNARVFGNWPKPLGLPSFKLTMIVHDLSLSASADHGPRCSWPTAKGGQ